MTTSTVSTASMLLHEKSAMVRTLKYVIHLFYKASIRPIGTLSTLSLSRICLASRHLVSASRHLSWHRATSWHHATCLGIKLSHLEIAPPVSASSYPISGLRQLSRHQAIPSRDCATCLGIKLSHLGIAPPVSASSYPISGMRHLSLSLSSSWPHASSLPFLSLVISSLIRCIEAAHSALKRLSIILLPSIVSPANSTPLPIRQRL